MITIRIRHTYGGLDYEDIYENVPMEVSNAIQILLRNTKYGNDKIKMYIEDYNKKEENK